MSRHARIVHLGDRVDTVREWTWTAAAVLAVAALIVAGVLAGGFALLTFLQLWGTAR